MKKEATKLNFYNPFGRFDGMQLAKIKNLTYTIVKKVDSDNSAHYFTLYFTKNKQDKVEISNKINTLDEAKNIAKKHYECSS